MPGDEDLPRCPVGLVLVAHFVADDPDRRHASNVPAVLVRIPVWQPSLAQFELVTVLICSIAFSPCRADGRARDNRNTAAGKLRAEFFPHEYQASKR
jgi:hypothetical protein